MDKITLYQCYIGLESVEINEAIPLEIDGKHVTICKKHKRQEKIKLK